MPYFKLDYDILDSSIWLQENSDTKVVWITMLMMADGSGFVASTAPGISHRANVSLEAGKKALSVLEAPDQESRTLANDGRRIERVDGGYKILNYELYRLKDYSDAAERMRRYRARKKQGVTEQSVTRRNALRNEDVDVDVKKDQEQKDLALSSEAAPRPPVLTLTLNGGREFPITEEYVQQMIDLYPSADVPDELRKMKAWLVNNPKKRKTRDGILRFIGKWLGRAHDEAKSQLNGSRPANSRESAGERRARTNLSAAKRALQLDQLDPQTRGDYRGTDPSRDRR